jgi:hypothetical protein
MRVRLAPSLLRCRATEMLVATLTLSALGSALMIVVAVLAAMSDGVATGFSEIFGNGWCYVGAIGFTAHGSRRYLAENDMLRHGVLLVGSLYLVCGFVVLGASVALGARASTDNTGYMLFLLGTTLLCSGGWRPSTAKMSRSASVSTLVDTQKRPGGRTTAGPQANYEHGPPTTGCATLTTIHYDKSCCTLSQ